MGPTINRRPIKRMTMKLFLIKTELAEYEPAEWTKENRQPVKPIGDNVLVLADKVRDQTRGGVHLPIDSVDKLNRAAESGVVIDLGDDAFRWNADRTKPFAGERPSTGTRVCFGRYS